jgi:hypothetical protein
MLNGTTPWLTAPPQIAHILANDYSAIPADLVMDSVSNMSCDRHSHSIGVALAEILTSNIRKHYPSMVI